MTARRLLPYPKGIWSVCPEFDRSTQLFPFTQPFDETQQFDKNIAEEMAEELPIHSPICPEAQWAIEQGRQARSEFSHFLMKVSGLGFCNFSSFY
jgi:hypothetical protein